MHHRLIKQVPHPSSRGPRERVHVRGVVEGGKARTQIGASSSATKGRLTHSPVIEPARLGPREQRESFMGWRSPGGAKDLLLSFELRRSAKPWVPHIYGHVPCGWRCGKHEPNPPPIPRGSRGLKAPEYGRHNRGLEARKKSSFETKCAKSPRNRFSRRENRKIAQGKTLGSHNPTKSPPRGAGRNPQTLH
jgi:hypothetical protein